MRGRIGFENHKIRCIIGVNPEERVKEQDIFIDLKVVTNFSRCAKTDDLNDTIDYVALAQVCTELACENKYRLLEKYASDVIDTLLDRFPILEVWIKIRKPKGLETADCSMIELTGKLG